MVDFSIEVKGLKELERELLALGTELAGKELRNALNSAGKIVYDAMKANAPESDHAHSYTENGKRVTVDPGHLRRSVKRSSYLNRRGQSSRMFPDNSVAKVSIGVKRVPYVAAIEYGAESRAPNPFIRRSLLENTDKVVDKFRAEIRRRIDKQLAKRNGRP